MNINYNIRPLFFFTNENRTSINIDEKTPCVV